MSEYVLKHTGSQLDEAIEKVLKDTGGGELGWVNGEPYKFTIIRGEYVDNITGAFISYSTWSRTDYIPCSGASAIVFYNNSIESTYNVFYDTNKNFISSFKVSSSISAVKVPSDAAYFVFSSTTTSFNSLIIKPQS